MLLKKLEISGFKSFGKKVELTFDAPITAIVGPNGSGKSNVSEAIRWVLGEQSMKSLRGRRGEDLIFHGSSGAAQLGKARVSIMFDNTRQTFPLDFSEVMITREVCRDGTNEYHVNDSAVRLKDIIQLMSNVGVGGSGHHIISQGEADRVLYASARDRKNMIEDALGLRIYHMKRLEAERKLVETKENMREVGMLRREIQPHMRFLKEQAVKVKASRELRDEYARMLELYIGRENAAVLDAQKALEEREQPLQEEYEKFRTKMQQAGASYTEDESHAEKEIIKELEKLVQTVDTIETERRAKEREIGRVEGQLAVWGRSYQRAEEETAVCSAVEVRKEMNDSLVLLERAERLSSLEEIHALVADIKNRFRAFLSRVNMKEKDTGDSEEQVSLMQERDVLLQDLQQWDEEKQKLLAKKTELEEARNRMHAEHVSYQKEFQSYQEGFYAAKGALQSLDVERERIRVRKQNLLRYTLEAQSLGIQLPHKEMKEDTHTWNDAERDKILASLGRLQIKLEEAGGINPEVLREYSEVEARDAFLSNELADLEKTAVSLAELTRRLEKELSRNFMEGVAKINMEFNTLFQTMFGGGSAKLAVVKLERINTGDALLGHPASKLEAGCPSKEDAGVDIVVDIPRKRVKNLDMLSGGERALTSIALLFAMSFVNPPPFLVLDETDAALDEANSQRYGAMLQNLSGKTQLIVITHNRQTMKEANVLYGVTMGSDGVSRLLSLKFEETAAVLEKKSEL